MALLAAGALDEAREPAEQAVALQPDRVEYRMLLARVLGELDRPQEAIAHLQHAHRLQPDWAEPCYQIGHRYAQMGRHDWALAHFRAALLRQPDHAAAREGVHAASLKGIAFAMDHSDLRAQHQAWAYGQFKRARRRLRGRGLIGWLFGRWRR